MPQCKGGPKRPPSHSGKRTSKSELAARVAALEKELAQTKRRQTRQVKQEQVTEEKKQEQVQQKQVKRELAEPVGVAHHLSDELEELRAELRDAWRQADESRAALADSNAKVEYLSAALQKTQLDLEWAVLLNKERIAPPTVLRQRARG